MPAQTINQDGQLSLNTSNQSANQPGCVAAVNSELGLNNSGTNTIQPAQANQQSVQAQPLTQSLPPGQGVQPGRAIQSAQQSSQVQSSVQTQIQPQSQDLAQSQPQSPPTTSHSFTGLVRVLVEKNFLNPDQAQQVVYQQINSGQQLEDIIQSKKLVTPKQLIQAKAELNKIPFIDIVATGIAPEAMNLIDEGVAKRYRVLPFAVDHQQKSLKVAMADPLNISAISFLKQKTGLDLDVYYAIPSEVERLIVERYAQDLSQDVNQALQETDKTYQAKLEKQQLTGAQGGLVRAAPINKIVNTILDYAMQSRASDVHVEPMTEKTRVRYRIDGILQEKLILPKSVHSAVVSRIKILSDLKIDEKRIPQDGRFDYKGTNQEVDLRVSTLPTIHGEKVVMRLLKKNAAVPALEELGLEGLALQHVRKAIQVPHGIILVTGPTGSGKTTTLYSILNIINTPKVNIMTLEDPVEYQMVGVSQVQVNPQAGLNFASGLRSFLRQDPDIIMVGEIRDSETAELAIQASLTGHLVFSTLHTNSAAGALPRLLDMEVEPFLLSSSVTLAMGQRVVRRINPEYKEAYKPEQAVIEDIKQVLGDKLDAWCASHNTNVDDITLYRPKADRPQTEPEYKGRIGIFEVMDITDQIREMINQRKPAGDLEDQATANGMLLMKQDGYLKALDGMTTIEEVLRVAQVSE